jgi:EAL domain-containing protein (putative c-di-GMP-specific phosphodiesterase class I)
MAEKLGLIQPIGAFVLRQACLDAAQVIATIKRPFKIVVNVSAYQLTREFVSQVMQALKESGLTPSYLTIELTESNLIEFSDYRLEILTSLRDIGVKLSLDDFGIGYSSFAYLNRFVVDTIKIDRSFIDSMLQQVSGRAIVSAILAIGHTLNLEVIAEGVESVEQLQFLKEQACHFYQGHLFSDALPFSTLSSFASSKEEGRQLDSQ